MVDASQVSCLQAGLNDSSTSYGHFSRVICNYNTSFLACQLVYLTEYSDLAGVEPAALVLSAVPYTPRPAWTLARTSA